MTNDNRIRELETQLAEFEGNLEAQGVGKQVDILNELSWMLVDIDLKRAQALSESAYALASSPDGGQPQYLAGMAYSLRTQGYLNQRLGNHPLGLTQLLRAQELFETLHLDDGLCDVLDGLSGIYSQIGESAESLKFIYQHIEIAQRLGDQKRIANAYNNLANIEFETGEYEHAVNTLKKNLAVSIEIGYKRIECLSYLNLAETYLLSGDYTEALKNSLNALPVCQTSGFEQFDIYAIEIIGKSYLKLGDPSQAIHYFHNALALSRKLESRVNEALILLNLGQAYSDLHQFKRALDHLQQGLAIAEAIDTKSEISKAHMLLSEVHEKRGDLAQALSHYKMYHSVKKEAFGIQANQRLQVLQVTHDIETARKEAEMLRIKTQELEKEVQASTFELRDMVVRLQHEVEERERAEAEIQEMVETLEQRVAARTDELATFFDLTLLTGQGLNLTEALEQILPRVIEITQSDAIGIDLLDPGRQAMQLLAQLDLPERVQIPLPIKELPLELQLWLEKPANPLNFQDLETAPFFQSAFLEAGFHTFLGAQIRVGNRVEGILSCFRFSECRYSLDETALVMALSEQIGIMVENHRLRQHAEEMAVLEERQRLARDIHDSVSQALYSLSLFSRAGREAAEDGDMDRLNFSLTELENNTLYALREMRLLLYELRPVDLQKEGLIRAIQLRLDTVERRVGLQLEVDLDEFVNMPPSCEIQLYYIIVEALNNVVKHAAATRLKLQLTQTGQNLYLQIADNGRGFAFSQPTGGFGLMNIQERIDQLNGKLSIISAQGEGTRLEIVIPCQEEIME